MRTLSLRLQGREAEVAETRSLLEGNGAGGSDSHGQVAASPPGHGKVSASTPHSLHLCQARPDKENKATDTSPGAEDSDYYTPEDPAASTGSVAGAVGGHFLVDQGTDTSLDTPLAETPSAESSGTVLPTPPSGGSGSNSAKNSPDAMALRRRRAFDDRCSPVHEEERPIELVEVKATTPLAPAGSTTTFEARTQATSPSRAPASSVGHVETSVSLPGTPASNASNRSSGDSCSSGSSTRLLLSGRRASQPQSKTAGSGD